MYRHLVILSVLVLSLSACGSNESPQVQHDASLSKAITAASASATKESLDSTTHPIVTSTPEECAPMAVNGCPKAGTPDCPKAETQDCPKAGSPDCPKASTLGCPKVAALDCPNTSIQESDKTSVMATESTPDQAEGIITENVEVESSSPTTSILTLSLQNEFGTVFVPHSQHVEMYSCEVCHTTTPPGKIEKTKKEFHALCRKCHVEEKAGPTKCRDCHQR